MKQHHQTVLEPRSRRRSVLASALLLGALFAPAVVTAQSWMGPASLGLQLRSSKGPVSGALVEIRHRRSGSTVGPDAKRTDANGQVNFVGISEGSWSLEAKHPDYLVFVTSVNLQAGKKPEIVTQFLEASGPGRGTFKVKFLRSDRPLGETLPGTAIKEPEVTKPAATEQQRFAEPPAPAPPAEVSPRADAADRAPTISSPATPAPSEPAETVESLDRSSEIAETSQPESEPEPEPSGAIQAATEAESARAAAALAEALADASRAAEETSKPEEPTTPRTDIPAAPVESRVSGSEDTRVASASDRPADASGVQDPSNLPVAEELSPPKAATGIDATVASEPETAPEAAAPTSAAPAESEPAPQVGNVGDALTAYRDRTCFDCKPGEWAAAIELDVPSGAACRETAAVAIRRAMQDVAAAAGPQLARFAGPIPLDLDSHPLAQASAAAQNTLAPYLDPTSSCRFLAVVVPQDGRFTGFRFEARDSRSGGDCAGDQECEVGRARFLFSPVIARGERAELVYSVFENTGGASRTARMSAYFLPPPGWPDD